MLRLRKRNNSIKRQLIDDWDATSEADDTFEFHLRHKELKNELQHLQLESKLNQQIRRLIDQRLSQLDKELKSK